MAAILGVFQIQRVYGLLIASRPVINWNVIAVLINFKCVRAHGYFVRKEKSE
jgi:MtN3 and saliva related transmembrane protein